MADVLIKGMEMPTNCLDCSTKINPDERRCNYDGHIFEETLSKITTRRDENCPLAELEPVYKKDGRRYIFAMWAEVPKHYPMDGEKDP